MLGRRFLFIGACILAVLVIIACSPRQEADLSQDPNRSKHFSVESHTVSADTSFVVQWRDMPGKGEGRDWITLVPKDTPNDKWGQWVYTDEPSGQFEVQENTISEPGEYEIRAYYDYPSGGYEIQDTLEIIVQ